MTFGGRNDRSPASFMPPVLRWVPTDPIALASLIFLLALVLAGLLAEAISPYGPNDQDIPTRLAPGVWAGGTSSHLLGTDGLGRDMLSRLVHGVRLSYLIPLLAVGISVAIGVPLGLAAGYHGGAADAIIMRFVDINMALSTSLLILVVVVLVGPGVGTLIFVFGIAHWLIYARLVRGAVLTLRELPFIEGARVIGCTHRRVIVAHILPNVAGVIVSVAIVEMGRLMVAEAGLSFLGFGVQPPELTWGLMIAAGRSYLAVAWWLVTLPGLAIALSVLAVSLVGNWIRSVNDPLQREIRGHS